MSGAGLPELSWSFGIDDKASQTLLATGTLAVLGRMPWSSNATFLVTASDDEGHTLPGIYKPEKGERPLWDFPAGLWKREVAMFRLSELLRWPVIPPTVINDGPLGIGSVQYFVETDYDEHYFTFGENPELQTQIRQMCLLDAVANNTDRKAGHVLLSDNRIWGIDNGLSFHIEPKIRTVIWEFANEALSSEEHDALSGLDREIVAGSLAELLSEDELDALQQRVNALVATGKFPIDRTGRGYPWPLV